MATVTECRQGDRLRAAIDRLHAAQLAALAARAAPDDDCRDVFGAARRLLEMLAEMGSLLVRLGQVADADEGAAAARRRLVTLATAGASALAALTSLAFELEGGPAHPEAGPGELDPAGETGAAPGQTAPEGPGVAGVAGGGRGREAVVRRPVAAAGPSPERAPTSMRAVADGNRLLVDQLKRLMQNAGRRESWRSRPPGELWRGLLAQVAGLLPLVAELEAGPLPEARARELARLAADAANYIAFIRFYPRLPAA
jgi:hypothetical protein